MITEEGLAALRVAATLTHGLPELRARILGGGRTLVEVREGGCEDEDDDALPPRVMTPCAFCCAVARAHRLNQLGRVMDLVGLTSDVDPTIELGAPPGGVVFPGGICRVPVGDQHQWGFAVTLDARVAFDLGQDLVESIRPRGDVVAMGLRRDHATDVTLFFARTHAAPGSVAEARLVDLFESLLARWTVHELITSGPDLRT